MQHKDFTTLLEAARQGDGEAFDMLYTRVYNELKKLARVVRGGKASDTMNTTALVHEAYEKLVPDVELQVQDRAHFFRLAARAMRFILIDSARKRSAEKRGGKESNLEFDEQIHATAMQADALLSLNEALKRLEDIDERKARVVECRYFAGLTIEDTAQALEVSIPTVKRDWRAARAWLAVEISPVTVTLKKTNNDTRRMETDR